MGGFTGGLALPIQPNDWAEELIKKMIRQTAKKAVVKACDTFDIFGDCDALSPDSSLIAILILIIFSLAQYVVNPGPEIVTASKTSAFPSSMTDSDGEISLLTSEGGGVSWLDSG